MAAMSDYLENAVLNLTLRGVAFTAISTPRLALFTSDPTDAGSGAEVTGGSYARQTAAFATPSNGVAANSADVSFVNMPAVTVTHVGVFDAASGGNLLYHGPLQTARTLTAGDTFTVRAGDLTVTLQ